MKNKKSKYLPRRNLPTQKRPRVEEPFSPTVIVERAVILTPPDIEKGQEPYWPTMHKAVGKSDPNKASNKSKYRVIRPQSFKVLQLAGVELGERSREIHRYDQRQSAMERLALLLQERLHDSLMNVPSELAVGINNDLSSSETSETSKRGRVISKFYLCAGFEGWRGRKASYPNEDRFGSFALQQLAAEDRIYRQALEDINPWLSPYGIVRDPELAVLERKGSDEIPNWEVDLIKGSIQKENALPRVGMITDPVVRLVTGVGQETVYLPRSLGYLQKAA